MRSLGGRVGACAVLLLLWVCTSSGRRVGNHSHGGGMRIFRRAMLGLLAGMALGLSPATASAGTLNVCGAPNQPACGPTVNTTQVVVDAKQGWQRVPLTVNPQDDYSLTYVSGQWTVDGRLNSTGSPNWPYVGPDGYSSAIDQQILAVGPLCKVINYETFGTLLVDLEPGSNPPIDAHGDAWSGGYNFTVSDSMYLRINDQCLGDNAGSVTMKVTEFGPPPSAPSCPTNPSVAFTPNSGPLDTRFSITGSGWLPGGTVTSTIPYGSPGWFPGYQTTTVDSAGRFSYAETVGTGPNGPTPLGAYPFTYVETYGGCSLSFTQTFTVTGGGTPGSGGGTPGSGGGTPGSGGGTPGSGGGTPGSGGGTPGSGGPSPSQVPNFVCITGPGGSCLSPDASVPTPQTWDQVPPAWLTSPVVGGCALDLAAVFVPGFTEAKMAYKLLKLFGYMVRFDEANGNWVVELTEAGKALTGVGNCIDLGYYLLYKGGSLPQSADISASAASAKSMFQPVPKSQFGKLKKLPPLRQRFGYAVVEVGSIVALNRKYETAWRRGTQKKVVCKRRRGGYRCDWQFQRARIRRKGYTLVGATGNSYRLKKVVQTRTWRVK
jgi:hypothetical protein